MKNQIIAKEIRFKVQVEEKEVDLLALEDYDSESNEENSMKINPDFLLNLIYQNKNRQPIGLPTSRQPRIWSII